MQNFATSPKTQKIALRRALQSPLIGKHGKRKTTLLREEMFRDSQNKIMERTLGLIEKQLELAIGDVKVFVSRHYWEGKGKSKKLVREKPKLITDEDERSEAIDYEFGVRTGKEDPNVELKHYFVMVKEPNLKAINSLLDRVFGKPTENKNLSVETGMGTLLDTEIDL